MQHASIVVVNEVLTEAGWSVHLASKDAMAGVRQRSPWNYTLRAHADRITCLKLVVAPSRRARKRRKFESHSTVPGGSEGASEIRYKYCRQAWLITGAIDGWVRVWDLGRMMEEQQGRAAFKGTEQDTDSEGASGDRVTTNSLSDRMRSLGMTARVTGSTTPVGSKPPIAGGDPLPLLTPRRRAERSASGHSAARGRPAGREYLVCSICTAADVTALDAELHSSPRDDSGAPQRTKLRIACGSYYVSLDQSNKMHQASCSSLSAALTHTSSRLLERCSGHAVRSRAS